jgi:hypothetical protein
MDLAVPLRSTVWMRAQGKSEWLKIEAGGRRQNKILQSKFSGSAQIVKTERFVYRRSRKGIHESELTHLGRIEGVVGDVEESSSERIISKFARGQESNSWQDPRD